MTINQSFYHSETILSSFQHTPNNFRCLFRRVRSYDKKDITRLFSYRHLYQVLGRQQPSTSPRTVIDADTPLFLTDRSTLSTLTASAEWFIYLLTYLPTYCRTKFIGGHEDVCAGVLTTRTSQHWKQIMHLRQLLGGILVCCTLFLCWSIKRR